jgi:hypothetical protein
VVHLLYAPPIQRGRCLVLEDLPTLRDVPVSVDLPVEVTGARLVPDDRPLEITRSGERVSVTIPEFSCHCAVVFSYAR